MNPPRESTGLSESFNQTTLSPQEYGTLHLSPVRFSNTSNLSASFNPTDLRHFEILHTDSSIEKARKTPQMIHVNKPISALP